MDRDRRGRFVKGNKAQMKAEIGKRARYERLPGMRERQRVFQEADDLMEELAESVPKKPQNKIALKYISDAMMHRASMELAFRMTGETIDEAAYAKTGTVIPHGCLEEWNKNSQEMRRWLKAIGIDMDKGADESESLIDLARKKYDTGTEKHLD